MKQLITILALIISCSALNAQQGSKSATLRAGYQSKSERFGVGVDGRYEIIDNLRIAPELTFFFPKNHVTGLDINVNAQYTFKNVLENLTVYPLAGLNMGNNRVSVGGYSSSSTDFGFNLGGGADYNLDSKSYLNFDMKVTFSESNYGQFMFGYGIRF